MSARQQKVIVIGLDSATPKMLFPWAKKGLLPNLKKLMEKGAFGRLESTIPPMTGPASESSMTGKNPGKHGIFDFVKFSNKYHKLQVVTTQDRKATPVWEILSAEGKSVIVVNYPMGYPPQPVNGVFVAGMDTPSFTSQFTFPNSVREEILKEIPDYQIDINFGYLKYGTSEEFLDHVIRVAEARKKATFYLMKKYPWDFLMVFFICCDRLGHFYFHDKEILLAYYKKLDQIIGEFLERVDKQTSVIIYSSHGMGSFKKEVYINTFLKEKGYLKASQESKKQTLSSRFLKRVESLVKKIIHTAGLYSLLITTLPPGIFKFLTSIFPGTEEYQVAKFIDWEKSQLFLHSPSSCGLMVNPTQRSPKAYNKLREKVAQELKGLKDPATGVNVIKEVFKKEKCYWGSYLGDAPDLIIEPTEGYYLSSKLRKRLFGKPDLETTGGHTKEGVVILYGPRVKSGIQIKDAKIYDVAPTVLSFFGFDVPEDMDGWVLAGSLTKRGSRTAKRKELKPALEGKVGFRISEEEEEKVKERLRSLGYI